MSIGGNGNSRAGNDDGDIDNLLADIEGPRGGRSQSTYDGSAGNDDIDDLLSGLGGGGNNKRDVGMDAIDDLLADLTG